MKPTPINLAEAIIEPFWDPQLSGLKEWQIEPGTEHGLRVFQNWCWVGFEWARRPIKGPALCMLRRFEVDCTGYDRLLVSVMAPKDSIFRLVAMTNRGKITFEAPPAPALKKEYAVDLNGATRIHTITLEIDAAADGVATGWFNWIGLQNSQLLERYLAQWNRFDSEWAHYLRPPSYEPRFEPAYGILINREELSSLRAEHSAFLQQHGDSPFMQGARRAQGLVPERMIHDFVNFWTDTRYCRERDYGHLLLRHGPEAAIAGLLLRDKELLRLGARYALALAMCDHWDDGFICRYPGSTFEHRCFVRSLCVHEIALLLDLAGELFTDLGREYLLRRIAEEGIGGINYITWKHEYIFHCNQLAWFTPGRMLGYLVLERAMPRVRPYTELAYQDLLESLGYTILADGGYVEGPTYFRCVARDGGLSLYYYARARGREFRAVIPEAMRRTAAFAEALASTDENTDVIPVCDATSLMEQEGLAVMAALLPDSQWVTMYHKSLARAGGMPDTILAWQLSREIPSQGPEMRPFTFLPEMGVMASVRWLDGERIKLLIMGNKAGAGHTHEDKGSFVLEFAGETFALDPGTCDYANPLAELLTHCERHNMLVPTGTLERPHPQNPLPVDVKPQGEGDETRFQAQIDATPGWEPYFKKWVRHWDSPTPDVLIIRDEYELVKGDGVEFYWQTQREVSLEGNLITLTGKRGMVNIEVPPACTARVDKLPLYGGHEQYRITISKKGRVGALEVKVKLQKCLANSTEEKS